MRLALALFALAACASDPTGPQTVTIDNRDLQGMVQSTPAGIVCGACALAGGCGSNEPATGSDCSADFDVGSSVMLTVTEQSVYSSLFCSSPQDATVKSCTFTVHRPMTVVIKGYSAVR